jgi:hypothetical protein
VNDFLTEVSVMSTRRMFRARKAFTAFLQLPLTVTHRPRPKVGRSLYTYIPPHPNRGPCHQSTLGWRNHNQQGLIFSFVAPAQTAYTVSRPPTILPPHEMPTTEVLATVPM